MKVLVLATHPDDEVLGMGGTIARLASEGNHITVAIVTRGWEPLFPDPFIEKGRNEAREANNLLGTQSLLFLDIPVTKLNLTPRHELNEKFNKLMDSEQPEMIFLPFAGDRHIDHREVFEAALISLRPGPNRKYVKKILCYETISETHWASPYIEPNFEPNLWIDISNFLETKINAIKKYESQLQPEPYARSLEALTSLAKWRGSIAGMHAAECFYVVRECV